MTVVNPKSISGINSITTGSGSDNLLTIHTSDASSTERVRINSSGDVIVGSGITVSPDGDIFATGVTTSTTFVGALTGNVTGNVTGNISGGTVAGSTGTFSAAVSGTTGTFTGDVDIADKIVHTGDTDTAIRFSAADTVSVETGGTNRITVNNTTGVNTLDVAGGTRSDFFVGRSNQSVPTADVSMYRAADNTLALATASAERLRIASDGAVGVNSTAPQTAFDVLNTGQTGITDVMLVKNFSAGNSFIRFQDNDATSHFSLGVDDGAGLGANSFVLYDRVNSAYRMGVDNSGNMKIHSGNVVIGTSGKGIDFSANANASGSTSELLDDYEEGSWSANQFNYDYDGNVAQRGHYTKIGRIVHAFFRIKFHTQSTYTGQHLRFSALPFTSANGSPYDLNVGGFAGGYSSIDYFRIYVQPGSTYAYWYTPTGNNYNNSTSLNNADVRGCITYTAAT
jgi:hypothetical protein